MLRIGHRAFSQWLRLSFFRFGRRRLPHHSAISIYNVIIFPLLSVVNHLWEAFCTKTNEPAVDHAADSLYSFPLLRAIPDSLKKLIDTAEALGMGSGST